MKPNIHPDYQEVVFHDTSADTYFVIGSTLKTTRTIEYKGSTYPYFPVEVSSASHPQYTGKQQVSRQEGRIAKFKTRFGKMGSK